MGFNSVFKGLMSPWDFYQLLPHNLYSDVYKHALLLNDVTVFPCTLTTKQKHFVLCIEVQSDYEI